MRIYEARLQYTLLSEGTLACISSPTDVVEYLRGAFESHPVQEQFFVLFLNRRNRALGRMQVTLGTLTSTLVSPREVFRGAILANAASIVVAHNHPSGDPAPSQSDRTVTQTLRAAGEVLEISVTDHVIIGSQASDPCGCGFFSFKSAGII